MSPKRLENNWYLVHTKTNSRSIAFQFETAASYTEIIPEQYPSWWFQSVKANYIDWNPLRQHSFQTVQKICTTCESKQVGYHKHTMNMPEAKLLILKNLEVFPKNGGCTQQPIGVFLLKNHQHLGVWNGGYHTLNPWMPGPNTLADSLMLLSARASLASLKPCRH